MIVYGGGWRRLVNACAVSLYSLAEEHQAKVLFSESQFTLQGQSQ